MVWYGMAPIPNYIVQAPSLLVKQSMILKGGGWWDIGQHQFYSPLGLSQVSQLEPCVAIRMFFPKITYFENVMPGH